MEYFDAAEEMHYAIQSYMQHHDGAQPTRIYISPFLYQWLASIRKEEAVLHGQDPESISYSSFPTELGELQLVIDEALSAYEIIPE